MSLKSLVKITGVYDALSVSKNIEIYGGSSIQNYYSESNTFIPNRFLTPLILTPIIHISDPHGIVSSEDRHSELEDCKWYEDGKEIIFNSSIGYELKEDNSLLIKKNSDVDIEISYSAKFLDRRKNQYIFIEDSVRLITIALSESMPRPRMFIDKPLNYIENPLKENEVLDISADILDVNGSIDIPLYWYIKYKGTSFLKIKITDPIYISGLDTKHLKLDRRFLDSCEILVSNSNDIYDKNTIKKLFKYYREFPTTLYINILATTILSKDSDHIIAKAIVGYNGGIITNPTKYFRINWYKVGTYGNLNKVSEGELIKIPKKDIELMLAELVDLGIYKILLEKDSVHLTDENNNKIIIK